VVFEDRGNILGFINRQFVAISSFSTLGTLIHLARPEDAAKWVEGLRRAGLPE
jgi:hypothetical protein